MERHDRSRPENIAATDDVPIRAQIYERRGRRLRDGARAPRHRRPQRIFRHIGPWLARRGLRVVTIDYRGIRGSGGREATRSATLTQWARRDAVGALRHIEGSFGGPTLLMAHSFAGQMIGLRRLGHFGLLRPAAAERVWPGLLAHFTSELSCPTGRNIVPRNVTPA